MLERRGGPELGAVTLPSPATFPGLRCASPRRVVLHAGLRAGPCLALSWSGAAQPGPGMLISAARIWSAASEARPFPSTLCPQGRQLLKVSAAPSPHHRAAQMLPVSHVVLWEMTFKPLSVFAMAVKIPEAA